KKKEGGESTGILNVEQLHEKVQKGKEMRDKGKSIMTDVKNAKKKKEYKQKTMVYLVETGNKFDILNDLQVPDPVVESGECSVQELNPLNGDEIQLNGGGTSVQEKGVGVENAQVESELEIVEDIPEKIDEVQLVSRGVEVIGEDVINLERDGECGFVNRQDSPSGNGSFFIDHNFVNRVGWILFR
ncbi:unnamed protein product, partial [Ilex paraguariensis]